MLGGGAATITPILAGGGTARGAMATVSPLARCHFRQEVARARARAAGQPPGAGRADILRQRAAEDPEGASAPPGPAVPPG